MLRVYVTDSDGKMIHFDNVDNLEFNLTTFEIWRWHDETGKFEIITVPISNLITVFPMPNVVTTAYINELQGR